MRRRHKSGLTGDKLIVGDDKAGLEDRVRAGSFLANTQHERNTISCALAMPSGFSGMIGSILLPSLLSLSALDDCNEFNICKSEKGIPVMTPRTTTT
ncbi:hypothetical protein, partial [Collimonas fungivorans]|uniref:hypothetical protein n=1 Tax=Collimonas fungivorans TaxID=158899 RepID=UPI003FA3CB5D